VLSQQVLYRSTSTNGDPIAVSGTVLVPTDPWKGQGPRPLVAVAPGTRGLGDLCAPSYTLTQGTDYEDNFISDLLKRGWAVAMTNYEGLGTPGMHTYMVGRAEGHAVLDIARAASRMAGTGLSPNGPIAVAGYSQGGGAAGWAAQLAPSYAPELQLLGVAAGGVPADLAATVNALNGGPFVVFALLGGVGFDAAYPELQLSNYLNDQGRRLLSHADTACLVNAGALPVALQTPLRNIDDFTTTNPLHVPAWQSRIAENSLGTMTPTVPLFLYHGAADEIVPLGQARRLRQTWCAQGANIQWSLWPGEHVLTMQEASSSVVNWLDDRFTGKPTTSNC
jgi:pimeloyl-ACP methyl ester carboxylesterase